MIKKTLSLVALGLISLSASAATIPYPGPGVNPTSYSFTAATTGDIIAYFYGQSAGYGSVIGLSINGAAPLSYGLQNHTADIGDSFNMGSVVAGDILRFVLAVATTGGADPTDPIGGSDVTYYLNSNPTSNPDGGNYIYSDAFGGGIPPGGLVAVPPGTYVGFEDILLADPINDFDYNDHQFVFLNVSTSAVPDGGMTIMMLGMAFTGLAWLRRKL